MVKQMFHPGRKQFELRFGLGQEAHIKMGLRDGDSVSLGGIKTLIGPGHILKRIGIGKPLTQNYHIMTFHRIHSR